DCGSALVSGSVNVSFSNGDPALALVSLQDGRWSGTWQARDTRMPQVTVTATAEKPELNLRGAAQVTGGLRGTASLPVINPVAAAQPGIFTKDQSGKGQGRIVDAQGQYVDAGNPAKAKDTVVIYCAGLGAVDPPSAAGVAAAGSSHVMNPVVVTIGGVEAPV